MINKNNEIDLLEEAKFFFLNRQYDKAEKLLKEFLKENPGDPDALYHLALLYEVTNQLEEAINYFKKVLEKKPNHEEAQKHLDKLTESL